MKDSDEPDFDETGETGQLDAELLDPLLVLRLGLEVGGQQGGVAACAPQLILQQAGIQLTLKNLTISAVSTVCPGSSDPPEKIF